MPDVKPPWYRRLAKWFFRIVVRELVDEYVREDDARRTTAHGARPTEIGEPPNPRDTV